MPRPFVPPLAAILLAGAACSPTPALAQDDPAPAAPAAEPLADGADATAGDDRDRTLRLMREFADAFSQIRRNYAQEIDEEELLEAAIDGMTARLDPYSTYLDDEEIDRFSEEVGGRISGIGVQILPDARSGRLTIAAPLPGAPAAEAGLRSGDVIVEVDGEGVEGLDAAGTTALIKGEAGEPVTLGVLRAGGGEIEQITVTRAVVRVPGVLGEARRADGTWDFNLPEIEGFPRAGLIRLTRFGPGVDRELAEALAALGEAGAEGVILDLRGNPGGLLSQAVAVTDLFLEGGGIVSTEGRTVAPQAFEALPGGVAEDLPLVVLVDGFSASASEIVAAALQDAGRATIVGERTFGKGSVQTVIDLGGRSALKLTTAGYLRPSGANIQRPGPMQLRQLRAAGETPGPWGVSPDEGFAVPLTRRQRRDLALTRLQKDRPEGTTLEDVEGFEQIEDPQLKRALEALRERIAAKAEGGRGKAEGDG